MIYAFSFLIGIAFVSMFNFKTSKSVNSYTFVRNEMTLEGEVKMSFEYKSTTQVRLTNGERYALPWAENYNYEKNYLYKFLMPKDTIYKKKYSDTLFIKRNGREFYFIFYKRLMKDEI